MNRAAAVLASSLALVVAACGPPPAPPVTPYTDVTFYWSFQDGDGNVYGDYTAANSGCLGANVDTVIVTLNGPVGSNQWTVSCEAPGSFAPGATFTNLPAGTYQWSLQGRRLGLTAFSAQGTSDFVASPVFGVRLLALYPNMDLYYWLPPGRNCSGVAEIAFELDNLVAGVVEYSSANVYVACQMPPGNGFTMPSIPPGQYQYRFVEAIPTIGAPLYKACAVGPFTQVTGGVRTDVDLFLGDGTFCP